MSETPARLVAIYTARDIYEANMVKATLAEAQIECFIGYELGPAYPLGPIEVRVPESRAEEARELIEEFQRAAPLLEEEPDYD